MDAVAMRRSGRRAALNHLALGVLLLAPAILLAPAKFERAGAWLVPLLVALLAGGAASAHAACTARARHGVQWPRWSALDRGWWLWDPPFRAFHWAMCAQMLLLTWALILAAVAFEAATGMRVPTALDAIHDGAGRRLTGAVVAVAVACGGYVLARRWARQTPG